MDICTIEADQAFMRVSYKAHGAKYTKFVSELSFSVFPDPQYASGGYTIFHRNKLSALRCDEAV